MGLVRQFVLIERNPETRAGEYRASGHDDIQDEFEKVHGFR